MERNIRSMKSGTKRYFFLFSWIYIYIFRKKKYIYKIKYTGTI